MGNLALAAFLLAAANAWTFVLFWYDKSQALRDGPRVPERTLLRLAAAGGSLGAKAGQRRFRHKTRKQPFARDLNRILAVQVALCLAAGLYLLAAGA